MNPDTQGMTKKIDFKKKHYILPLTVQIHYGKKN
jgi:hypothetical protein